MIRQNILARLIVIIAALWLGMQIMAGYIAAPVLFSHLPKMQAGEIAGILFGILSWTGLVIWAGVFFVQYRAKVSAAKLTAVLWLFLCINEFLVTPVIEAYKNNTTNWLLSLLGGSFGAWHGISSIIFMFCALLAVISVWKTSKTI